MSQGTPSPFLPPLQALEWYVVVETGSLAGQRFPIGGAAVPLTLGRDAGCTIRFDPNQERLVGRRHARLEARSDGLYLIDENSANGTFKEGQPVREVRLRHGDRFQLGGEVEGVQGPWIAIHMPVAVHVAPPAAEVATLISRPSRSNANLPTMPFRLAPPFAPLEHTPAVPSVAAASTAPRVGSPSLAPQSDVPSLPVPAAAETEPKARVVPQKEFNNDAQDAAVSTPPQPNPHRTQLVRQIVGIVLLLFFSCALGVALGMRKSAEPDSESAARSE